MNDRAPRIADLRVKIFADGADLAGILEMANESHIRGFTTNPTLMRKAGVDDYLEFARSVLRAVPDRPISFEVFADEFDEMERQALLLAELGSNVYVKIPVTTTSGQPCVDLIRGLAGRGLQLNVTALMTLEQVREVAAALERSRSSLVSVFAGRIADTGRDPVPVMAAAVEVLEDHPGLELVWASPREVLNVFQADAIGCHIITATHEILRKLSIVGENLDEYSLETVRMFHHDAVAAGYTLSSSVQTGP